MQKSVSQKPQSKQTKNSKKFSARKIIKPVILTIASIALIYSGIKITEYIIESNATKSQITNVQSIAKLKETTTENPNIATAFLTADINALKQLNEDTIGWVEVYGTNINYPVVQTTDNDYYLHHSFDKTTNSAGWVFLDYRNSPNLTDKNTIIYAHGRYDGTMFGSLRNLLTSDWQNNSKNHYVRTITENGSAIWEIFSFYKLPTTTDYLKPDFKDEAEFDSFINLIASRSIKNYARPTSADQVLTLTTCFNDREKLVLHAKLIASSQN